MKYVEKVAELRESAIIDLLVELFEPKVPTGLTFNAEPDLIYAEFSLNQMDARVEFERLDLNSYEVAFTTKDNGGVYSLGLKDFSNTSLRLFNYIIGIIIEFGKVRKVDKFIIVQPPHDPKNKRMNLYAGMLKRPEVKRELNALGYNVYAFTNKIELSK
jgi:sporulation protein YlmC with PRC-barrel domain